MSYNFLIVTSSFPAITGENFEGVCVEVFAETLVRLGHHVTILTHCVQKHYYKDSPLLKVNRFYWAKQVKPMSMLSIRHDFGKIGLYFANGLKEASKIARDHNIDFVICAWALPSGLLGLYLKQRYGIPYVIWSLGSDIWSYASFWVTRGILRRIFNHAVRIYADGFSLIEEIHAITQNKASFLPTSRILPKMASSNLSLNPALTHFLFVGRYHTNKGPDILVEAIHLLPSDLQEKSYFHFFGIGDMKGDLKFLIEKYNLTRCIHLNDLINNYNLSRYLEAVDFLVIPSRVESIPVILSDALQKGCPIIATNVGDMGDLLTQHDIGHLSQRADPQCLSAALSEAMSGKKIAIDQIQRFYHLFDPVVNVKKFLQDLKCSYTPTDQH